MSFLFDKYNEPPAEAARDEALQRVGENAEPWTTQAVNAIAGYEFDLVTGEDIRLMVEPDLGPPHHHNAWGAVIRMAITRNLLIPTDQFRKMKTEKSHARMTRVYRKG